MLWKDFKHPGYKRFVTMLIKWNKWFFKHKLQGKVIDSSSIVEGYAKDIIGEDISSRSFNAAFEHTHQNSGETRVMYFDNGPVSSS